MSCMCGIVGFGCRMRDPRLQDTAMCKDSFKGKRVLSLHASMYIPKQTGWSLRPVKILPHIKSKVTLFYLCGIYFVQWCYTYHYQTQRKEFFNLGSNS